MLKLIRLFIILAGVAGFSNAIWAHARITTSIPENGAILQESPDVIELSFSADIWLTRVTVQLGGELITDVNVDSYNSFNDHFEMPHTIKTKGIHLIKWWGLGRDGHVRHETISFEIK